jgi:endoglucanase
MKTLGVMLLLLVAICANAQFASLPLGINICGSEFGEDKLPGTLNVDYVYPNSAEINYFYSKGFKVINLPFRWERIQRTLGGELDSREVEEIKKFISSCNTRGIKVILSMHNFGRYKVGGIDYVIGSNQVTRWHYRDVWKKIASLFNAYPNILGYAIMTEPYDMRNYNWASSAQEAINAIRETGNRNNIIVDGDNYSCSEEWTEYNDDLKRLKDPYNKIVFDAHCYFDDDHSGKYISDYSRSNANAYTGVARVKPFVEWLKRNYKKGMIGEFGVPAYDNKWLTVMDNFLQYISANGVPANYWAAGSWWSNYQLSIEPTAYGADKPQMNVLLKYINGSYNKNNYAIAADYKVISADEPVIAQSATTSSKNNSPNNNKRNSGSYGSYAIIATSTFRYAVRM